MKIRMGVDRQRLIDEAKDMKAPILISANSLRVKQSAWRIPNTRSAPRPSLDRRQFPARSSRAAHVLGSNIVGARDPLLRAIHPGPEAVSHAVGRFDPVRPGMNATNNHNSQ